MICSSFDSVLAECSIFYDGKHVGNPAKLRELGSSVEIPALDKRFAHLSLPARHRRGFQPPCFVPTPRIDLETWKLSIVRACLE